MSSIVIPLFDFLLHSKLLSLVAVDEVHQYVIFGSDFRRKFLELNEKFFSKLILSHHSHHYCQCLCVPVLFMTAKFNQELLHPLELLTSLHFYSVNYFWSKRTQFARRTVKIECIFSNKKKRLIKDKLKERLPGNIDSKDVVYSSSAKTVESIIEDVDKFINYPDTIEGDNILIIGDLESDWKFV